MNRAMVKHWLQVLGYSVLAALAVGLPAYQLFVSDERASWGGLLVVTLGLTIYLCWVYRAGLDLPGRTIFRGKRGARRVALTFDDGPNGRTTQEILDVLRRHGARATFFCVGRLAASEPATVVRMIQEGHEIGNHTQDHRKLAWLGRQAIAHQIDAAQESIQHAGAPAPRWFRAPHGFKSPMLPALLRERGLSLCAWSHDIQDFHRPGVEVLVRRAKRGLEDGAIMLLHDGGGDRRQTVTALDEILRECQRRGLSPVTLSEVLAPPPA